MMKIVACLSADRWRTHSARTKILISQYYSGGVYNDEMESCHIQYPINYKYDRNFILFNPIGGYRLMNEIKRL